VKIAPTKITRRRTACRYSLASHPCPWMHNKIYLACNPASRSTPKIQIEFAIGAIDCHPLVNYYCNLTEACRRIAI